MKIESIVENLKSQRNHIDYMIDFLERQIHSHEDKAKAAKIIKSVKRKKLHWTQRPENRAKMLKAMKKAVKARHINE